MSCTNGCSRQRAAGYSSRSCLPVSATKTSSSVAECVRQLASGCARCRELAEQRRHGLMQLAAPGAATCRRAGSVARRRPAARSAAASSRLRRSATANSTTCSAPSEAISSRGVPSGDDPAVVDDRHAVAEPLGLVHVVGGQQDACGRRRGTRRSAPRAGGATAGRGRSSARRGRAARGRRRARRPAPGAAAGRPRAVPTRASRLLAELHQVDHLVRRRAARGRSCGRAGPSPRP